jgi:spore germination cell wall hydrolase CwlJ-like protein
MKISFLLWLASLLPQTQADQLCLGATVYLEARGQSVLGQKAVAEVALRRHESGRHGNTVCAVVREPGQFALSLMPVDYSFTDRAAMTRALLVASEVMRAWELPAPRRGQVVPGAKYFVALGSTTTVPLWAQGAPVATIGDHAFFR